MATKTYSASGFSATSWSKTYTWKAQADGNWTNTYAGSYFSENKTFLAPILSNYIKITGCSFTYSFTISNSNTSSRKSTVKLVDSNGNSYASAEKGDNVSSATYTLTQSEIDALNTNKPTQLGVQHVVGGVIKTPSGTGTPNATKSVTHSVTSTISEFTITLTYTSGTCRRWNGTGWGICEVYRYNGSGWESCELYRINTDGKKELCE